MAKTRGGPSARLVAIVDDDAPVRRSTRRLVLSFGFDAEVFGSAEEFLDSGTLAKAACLILDVRMPGMDGLELQRRLVAREPRIPIMFLTGHATGLEEREARRAGAVAFLRKPVPGKALLEALRAVLDEPAPSTGQGGDDGRH